MDPIARESLRGAMTDAGRKHSMRRIGGVVIVTLNALFHDLHDELLRCLPTEGPHTYQVSLVVNGDVAVGAMIESVHVDEIADVSGGRTSEVPGTAQRCVADILTAIELPATDGPMNFETIVSFDDPCPPFRTRIVPGAGSI